MVTNDTPIDPLPDDAILLHIGLNKTGTTALQAMLAAARPELAEHGVLYPGRAENHHKPARAIRGKRAFGESEPPAIEVWARFAEQVRAHPGRVVISSEYFSALDEAGQARLLRDLGPDRLHVVIALRHPVRQVPSWWQQVLKGGRCDDLDRWLEHNLARSDGTSRGEASIRRWSTSVGPKNMTAIIIDDRDRGLLPRTFEQLLALPPGTLADRTPRIANRSMTAPEAEFVRLVNAALRGKITEPEYTTLVRNGMIRRLVETRTPAAGERAVLLPDWAADAALRRGRKLAAAVTDSGVRTVGDLDYLGTPLPPPPDVGGEVEPTAVPVSAAVEAVVGVVAAATKGTWNIDGTRKPKPKPSLVGFRSAELAKTLAQRVRARVRRQLRR